MIYSLVGGLEHFYFMTFHILGMSSSKLTNSIIFQRGWYTTNQGIIGDLSRQPEWWYTGHIASYLRVVFWRDYMSDFDHFSSGYRWIWGVHCNRRSTEDRPLGRRTTYDNLLDDIGLGAMPERSYSLLTEAAESFGEVDLRRSPGRSPGKNKFCVCPRTTSRVTWLVLFWHLDTRSW